jgi:hypothetical protein
LGIGLVLLLVAGGLRWHSVQAERAAVAAAIDHAVKREAVQDSDPQVAARPVTAPMTGVQPQVQLEAQALTALAQSPHDDGAMTRLHRLERNVAVVEVVLPATQDQPALRQTRVYHYTGVNWVRMAPSAAHWGAPRQWEGEHLVFHYYAHDDKAVAEVAARLDARFVELHRLFLGEPPIDKLTVVVDPAQAPGEIASRVTGDEPLVVASPAAYLAPVAISQADLLAQSVVLALLDDLSAQTLLHNNGVGKTQNQVRRARMWQVLNGVLLWQLWATDLPLAVWRKPVVQWVYSNVPEPIDTDSVVPDFQPALCVQHQLWLTSPLAVQIPLSCDTPDRQEQYLVWRYFYPRPVRLAQLGQLAMPIAADAAPALQSVVDWPRHPAAVVALATLVEYAAAAHGPERIPLLLAEAGRHEDWATLIPAVFGVSVGEFEAGWQAYLTAHDGLDLPQEEGLVSAK